MENQNALTVFNFNQNQVRTIIDSDGTPLFCGKDVCDVLGYANASKAMGDHCHGVTKRYPIVDSLGRTQDARFLTEPDLYRLIVSSQMPTAQEFEKWVFEEVLPTIRKTGQYRPEYVAPSIYDTAASTFSGYTRVAKLFGLEGNAALISANVATRKVTGIDFQHDLQIELKTPDQQYLLTPTQIAERLHLSGPREANRLLAAKGLQTKESGQWVPTDKGKAFSALLDTGKRHTNGCMVQQLKWEESVLKEFELL